jgi:lipoprotein-releasing system ATP-binding protein
VVRPLSAGFGAAALHVLRGEANSGNEVLLRLLGLLEPPEDGEVLLWGRPTRALDEVARAALRNRECGFVFAAPFLLADFSIIENVAMPLFKISQVGPEEARKRTVAALEFVGLGGAVEAPATELSLADQRRVALARALVNKPALVFVEQLDAGFDSEAVQAFSALLRRAGDSLGVTVIATASPAFPSASQDRVLEIADGAIRSDSLAARES